MAKSRSNNPDGRPKEYKDQLRMIAVSLPEPLIEVLNHIAEDAGISRQRLIVESLLMTCQLNERGHLWTDKEGTHFMDNRFNKTNLNPTPEEAPPIKDVAQDLVMIAKKDPDFPYIWGTGVSVKRDVVVEKPGEQVQPSTPKVHKSLMVE